MHGIMLGTIINLLNECREEVQKSIQAWRKTLDHQSYKAGQL